MDKNNESQFSNIKVEYFNTVLNLLGVGNGLNQYKSTTNQSGLRTGVLGKIELKLLSYSYE